jgi:hypothetical protein
MSLGRTYRFSVLNSLGQTMATSAIVIKGRRWNFSSSGVQTWEASEAAIDTSGSTLANGAYFSGTTQDNSTNAYLGGTFKFTIIAPTSASGTVTVFLQRSTDGGTTWPDNGNGTSVKVFSFAAAGTQVDEIEI